MSQTGLLAMPWEQLCGRSLLLSRERHFRMRGGGHINTLRMAFDDWGARTTASARRSPLFKIDSLPCTRIPGPRSQRFTPEQRACGGSFWVKCLTRFLSRPHTYNRMWLILFDTPPPPSPHPPPHEDEEGRSYRY